MAVDTEASVLLTTALGAPSGAAQLGADGRTLPSQNSATTTRMVRNADGTVTVETDSVPGVVGGIGTLVVSAPGPAQLPEAEVLTVTLGASCSVVMPTFREGAGMMLYLRQDAIGTRTVTWPATVEWPNEGVPPVLSMNPGTQNTVVLMCPPGGAKWQGYVIT